MKKSFKQSDISLFFNVSNSKKDKGGTVVASTSAGVSNSPSIKEPTARKSTGKAPPPRPPPTSSPKSPEKKNSTKKRSRRIVDSDEEEDLPPPKVKDKSTDPEEETDYYETEAEEEPVVEPSLEDSAIEVGEEDMDIGIGDDFIIYAEGRVRYNPPEPDDVEEFDSPESIPTQNVHQITPLTLGYEPPMPEGDEVDFMEIEDDTNTYIKHGGRHFLSKNESTRVNDAVGVKAIQAMVSIVRGVPFTGVVQRRHHREAFRCSEEVELEGHPNKTFLVKKKNGVKFIVCRNQIGFSAMLCQDCSIFNHTVGLYGKKTSCPGCGNTPLFAVLSKQFKIGKKEYFFASAHAFGSSSMDAKDEIEGKVGMLWRNAINAQLKSYKKHLTKPNVKIFQTEKDAMTEFAAISTAAWLRSQMPKGKLCEFEYLMNDVCISKSRKLLKSYMLHFGVGLRSHPSNRPELDPFFVKVEDIDDIHIGKDLYVYLRIAFDALYPGVKKSISNPTSNISNDSSYSIQEYERSTGLSTKRIPILKVTKDNWLQTESICIQAFTIGYLLRRKIPIEDNDNGISYINYCFNLGKKKAGEFDLVGNFYNHTFGSTFEIYPIVSNEN